MIPFHLIIAFADAKSNYDVYASFEASRRVVEAWRALDFDYVDSDHIAEHEVDSEETLRRLLETERESPFRAHIEIAHRCAVERLAASILRMPATAPTHSAIVDKPDVADFLAHVHESFAG